MGKLPTGWVLTDIDSLGEYINGATFQPKDWGAIGKPIVRIQNLTDPSKDTHYYNGKLDPKYNISNGDILVSWSATLDVFLWGGGDAWLNQHIFKVIPDCCVDKNFLFYVLKKAIAELKSSDHLHGSTMKHINRKPFLAHKVLLPPLNEQKRIAEKLDQIMSEISDVRSRLDKIPVYLASLRTSTLIQAVSGDLTKDWRVKKGKKSGWKSKAFEELCEEITVGFVGKMSDQYIEKGVPFLRSQNVRPFKFDPNGLKFISQDFHHKLSKSKLMPKDVVVVRSGAPGQCCVIPEYLSEANCADLVILRPNKNLLSEFACIYINSETSQVHVRSSQVGVAQQHFNVGSMKTTPIMLPTTEEQLEIIRIVTETYGLADVIEQKYILALKKMTEISQSVLNKAFQGELVPQDCNDEAASILLERTKEEKGKHTEILKSKALINTGKSIRSAKKAGGKLMTRKLQEVLMEHQDWLSAQEVFQLCGVGNGAQTDDIERIYGEMRFLDKLGQLEIDAVYNSDGTKQYDRLKLKEVN